jgi:hypothetical protein
MDSLDKPRLIPDETPGMKDGLFIDEEELENRSSNRELNLLFLFGDSRFHAWLQRIESPLKCVPVFKDFLCIIRPESTWNRITASQRGAGFVFVFNLMPLMLLLALVEGHGLILLGRQQVAEGMSNRFTLPNVLVYEIASWLLAVLLICIAAALIRSLANACHTRNYLSQSLVVMFHCIGPMFLVQLLNGFPHIYLWLTWLVGVSLTIGALYNGLPRIMQPDPPSAMGLFVGSSIIVFLLMLGGRLLTGFYLAGDFKSLEKFLCGLATRLFS